MAYVDPRLQGKPAPVVSVERMERAMSPASPR